MNKEEIKELEKEIEEHIKEMEKAEGVSRTYSDYFELCADWSIFISENVDYGYFFSLIDEDEDVKTESIKPREGEGYYTEHASVQVVTMEEKCCELDKEDPDYSEDPDAYKFTILEVHCSYELDHLL